MKRANVSELKSRLSSYLAEVKKGDTVVVCERQTAIARLIPYEDQDRDFKVHEATEPLPKLREIRPVRLRKRVNVGKMLQDMRGDR